MTNKENEQRQKAQQAMEEIMKKARKDLDGAEFVKREYVDAEAGDLYEKAFQGLSRTVESYAKKVEIAKAESEKSYREAELICKLIEGKGDTDEEKELVKGILEKNTQSVERIKKTIGDVENTLRVYQDLWCVLKDALYLNNDGKYEIDETAMVVVRFIATLA